MNLSIGVIGTGIMGTDHVETITRSIAGAEVREVADLDTRRAETIAARFPGAKAVPIEALIGSEDVDAVIVASSDATHAQFVKASLAAGKPVLCEKPLTPRASECEEILRLEQARGARLVQVGFMRRFDAPKRIFR